MDDVTKVALILRRLHLWVMWVVFLLFHLAIVVVFLVKGDVRSKVKGDVRSKATFGQARQGA